MLRNAPAGARQLWAGRCLAAASILYLLPFVTRWWIPFDEGMIGQTADRVLHGQLPHVDFQEPYSGGLSWLYALVFRIWGIELAHVRWLLFAAAGVSVFLLYDIFRRYLSPLGAAAAVWTAIVWSFPNYFAGLPSWWLLFCAILAIWGFCRFEDSGARWPLMIAAIATGAAVAVKQTGVYQVIALSASLVYARGILRQRHGSAKLHLTVRWLSAAATVLVGGLVVWRAGGVAEFVYVFLPLAAVAGAVAFSDVNESATPIDLRLTASLILGLVLPIALLVAPYLWHGGLAKFANDALVNPESRLSYAHVGMLPPVLIFFGIPVMLLLSGRWDRWIAQRPALAWTVALGIVAAFPTFVGYQIVWQSTRAAAALLPPFVFFRLRDADSGRERRILVFAASFLAWLSLNQIPYPHPVYFCYVAPIAIVCAVAFHASASGNRRALLPWAFALIAFGVLVINRGTLDNIGRTYPSARPVIPLNLARAHLTVFPDSARAYQQLVPLVLAHLGPRGLMGGPDCPEVFFLTGQYNPTGAIFEFLDGTTSQLPDSAWFGRDVIVINHAPAFSPPVSSRLQDAIRDAYPSYENIGAFEVRWAQ